MTIREVITTIVNYLKSGISSGERVITANSSTVSNSYVLTEMVVSATGLDAADWSSGTVTATGIAGQLSFGTSHMYVCSGTNQWRRNIYGYSPIDIIIATIDDSTGLKTDAQLTSSYPTAQPFQNVLGVCGIYTKYTGGWKYYASKLLQMFVSANTTLIAVTGMVYLVDATSGNITLTLPAAGTGTIGTEVIIIRTDYGANTVTVNRAGSDTINNAATTFNIATAEKISVTGISATSWSATKQVNV